MDEYAMDDFTSTEMLLRQNAWPVFEQFLWLLILVMAAASLLAVLSCFFGMLWEALANLPQPSQTKAQPTPTTKLYHPTPILRRTNMKQVVMLIAAFFIFTGVTQAQDRPTTNGAICRISEYRFKPNTTPGKNNAQEYIKFQREHRVHILTEQKQQGLIVDFKFFHNDATGGPQEVQLVEAVCYRNYEDALNAGDNAERSQKLRDILVKHYGSLENMRKVIEPNQGYVELVRGYVLHEMTINPAKPGTSGN